MKRVALITLLLIAGVGIGRAQAPAWSAIAERIVTDKRSGTQVYTGDVEIVANGVTLHADQAVYTSATRTVELKGIVTAVLPETK